MSDELPYVRESIGFVLDYMCSTLELTCFAELTPAELWPFVCDGRPLFAMLVTERAKDLERTQ
jgi:hypothetical protein